MEFGRQAKRERAELHGIGGGGGGCDVITITEGEGAHDSGDWPSTRYPGYDPSLRESWTALAAGTAAAGGRSRYLDRRRRADE